MESGYGWKIGQKTGDTPKTQPEKQELGMEQGESELFSEWGESKREVEKEAKPSLNFLCVK